MEKCHGLCYRDNFHQKKKKNSITWFEKGVICTWTILHHSNIYMHSCSWLFPSKTRPLTPGCRERRNLAHYGERNWSSVVVRMLSEINSTSGGRPPASELLGSCNETNNISCLGRPLSAPPFSAGSRSWGRGKPGTYPFHRSSVPRVLKRKISARARVMK